MEGFCSCIWYWAWFQQGRQLGINDALDMGESKDKLELTSVSHWLQLQWCRSPARQAGSPHHGAAHARGPVFRDAEKGDSGGAEGASGPATAPRQQGKSADQDHMCELPQCLHRRSECRNSCPLTSRFQILQVNFSCGSSSPTIIRKGSCGKQNFVLTKLTQYQVTTKSEKDSNLHYHSHQRLNC